MSVTRFSGAMSSSIPVTKATKSPTESCAALDCSIAYQMMIESATAAINCTTGVLAALADTCFIKCRRTRFASWSKRRFS